jgi:hypothetical protein
MQLKIYNLTSPLVEIVVPGIGTIAPRAAAQYFPYSGEDEIGELGFSPHAILDSEVASGRLSYVRVAESADHGQIGCISVRISADAPERDGNLITGTDIIPVGAIFLGIVLKRAVAAGAAVTVDIGIAEDADRFFDGTSLNATGDVKVEATFNQYDIGGEQLVVTASGALLASDAEVKLFYLVP